MTRDFCGGLISRFLWMHRFHPFQKREQRDIAERGRDAESVKRQWDQTVHPMHSMYVESSREIADLVIDGTGDLVVAARELLARWKVQPDSSTKTGRQFHTSPFTQC